jgi:hypothetical protein
VRGKPPLGLDRREVLNVAAQVAADVLNQPVSQRSEVQRVTGGGGVVVAARIDGRAVVADLAVAGAGQGEGLPRSPIGTQYRRSRTLAARIVTLPKLIMRGSALVRALYRRKIAPKAILT